MLKSFWPIWTLGMNRGSDEPDWREKRMMEQKYSSVLSTKGAFLVSSKRSIGGSVSVVESLLMTSKSRYTWIGELMLFILVACKLIMSPLYINSMSFLINTRINNLERQNESFLPLDTFNSFLSSQLAIGNQGNLETIGQLSTDAAALKTLTWREAQLDSSDYTNVSSKDGIQFLRNLDGVSRQILAILSNSGFYVNVNPTSVGTLTCSSITVANQGTTPLTISNGSIIINGTVTGTNNLQPAFTIHGDGGSLGFVMMYNNILKSITGGTGILLGNNAFTVVVGVDFGTTQARLAAGGDDSTSYTLFNVSNNKVKSLMAGSNISISTANDVVTITGPNLSPYALTSSLTNYVTGSYLTTALSGYPTNASLTSTLATYVVSSTLSTYVTNAGLSSTLTSALSSYALTTSLSSYVTSTNLTSVLASYTSNSALGSTLASYVPTSALSAYVTNSSLTSQLSSYATAASLSSYVLSSALNNYATTSALSSLVSSGSLSTQLSGYINSALFGNTAVINNYYFIPYPKGNGSFKIGQLFLAAGNSSNQYTVNTFNLQMNVIARINQSDSSATVNTSFLQIGVLTDAPITYNSSVFYATVQRYDFQNDLPANFVVVQEGYNSSTQTFTYGIYAEFEADVVYYNLISPPGNFFNHSPLYMGTTPYSYPTPGTIAAPYFLAKTNDVTAAVNTLNSNIATSLTNFVASSPTFTGVLNTKGTGSVPIVQVAPNADTNEASIGFYAKANKSQSSGGDVWVIGQQVSVSGSGNLGFGCNVKNLCMSISGSTGVVNFNYVPTGQFRPQFAVTCSTGRWGYVVRPDRQQRQREYQHQWYIRHNIRVQSSSGDGLRRIGQRH